MDRRIVLGDDDRLDALADDQLAGRIEVDAALAVAQADQRAFLIGHDSLAEGLADQRGLFGGVDFAAVEIQQFRVDGAQAGLAARMHDDARDQVVGQHQLDLRAADHARHLGVLEVAYLGGDAVGLGTAPGIVDEREHRLDDLRIRIVAFRRQHDDRARGLRVDERQIVEVGRIAAAADHLRVAQRRHLGGDLVLHLDLVHVRHDDDARPLAAGIGDDELGDDVEDRGRPVEDDGVIALQHARAALAQLVELAVDAGAEHADQRRDDEDAAKRDDQHHEPESPAGIAAHRSGIERAHQRFPERLDEGQRLAAFRRDPGHRQEGAGDDDDHQRQDRQPADQRDRAGGHGLVELVAQAGAERGFLLHCCRRNRRFPLLQSGSRRQPVSTTSR